MTDSISAEGVSVNQIRLRGEDVLVRPAPQEEQTASGLFVPNRPSESVLGGVFYGEVVAVGPGRLVEAAPSPEEVGAAIEAFLLDNEFATRLDVSLFVVDLLRRRQTGKLVPLPWKVGDRVVVRQGFGTEILLREGRFQVVGRGALEHGHGVLAAWDSEHKHCWHAAPEDSISCYHHSQAAGGACEDSHGRPLVLPDCGRFWARCACGESRVIETRLPACSSCPPGERLAEAVLGGKVVDMKPGEAPKLSPLEMKPEEDDSFGGAA